MIEKQTTTKPSPGSAIQDPSRRRTEIYMRADQHSEHFKLRGDAEEDLQSIEKLHDTKTDERVNELIAANAATQATVAAMADDNSNIKACLLSYCECKRHKMKRQQKQKLSTVLN